VGLEALEHLGVATLTRWNAPRRSANLAIEPVDGERRHPPVPHHDPSADDRGAHVLAHRLLGPGHLIAQRAEPAES